MLDRILQTRDDVSLVLIRLSVGLVVFFPEGLQKLLFPDILGAGRLAAIGIPWPALLGRSRALDQGSDPSRPRLSDLPPAPPRPLRVLEHAARGARGPLQDRKSVV